MIGENNISAVTNTSNKNTMCKQSALLAENALRVWTDNLFDPRTKSAGFEVFFENKFIFRDFGFNYASESLIGTTNSNNTT